MSPRPRTCRSCWSGWWTATPVRQLHIARWGLVPSWAKDPGIGSKMINARSESVLEKPAFRKATRARRCAVPADGYYEWKGEGRGKQPYYVHPKDGRPIVFAGLYEWWKDPSKAEGDPERWLLSTSILTTDSPPEGYAGRDAGRTDGPARPGAAADGPRRPCRPGWTRRPTTPPDWSDLVRAGAHDVAEGWTIDAVGTAVGNVRNDSPELIEPVGSLF